MKGLPGPTEFAGFKYDDGDGGGRVKDEPQGPPDGGLREGPLVFPLALLAELVELLLLLLLLLFWLEDVDEAEVGALKSSLLLGAESSFLPLADKPSFGVSPEDDTDDSLGICTVSFGRILCCGGLGGIGGSTECDLYNPPSCGNGGPGRCCGGGNGCCVAAAC